MIQGCIRCRALGLSVLVHAACLYATNREDERVLTIFYALFSLHDILHKHIYFVFSYIPPFLRIPPRIQNMRLSRGRKLRMHVTVILRHVSNELEQFILWYTSPTPFDIYMRI